jgi:hypothetical protein
MAEAREVRVKLIADTSEYVAAMNAAKLATKGLARGYWRLVGVAAIGGAAIGSLATLLLTQV